MRFFNTISPVNPADHYCVPPLERFDLDAAGCSPMDWRVFMP